MVENSFEPESRRLTRRTFPAELQVVGDAYRQVKDRLNELVNRFADEGELRLPAEDQLSVMLGVSRPTVRSALLSLQKEGKIQRVHGRGTFINRYALTMRANIAEDRPFMDLLTQLGYKTTLRTLSMEVADASADIAALLDRESRKMCVIQRVFEADGKPAVLSTDYVPVDLLPEDIAGLEPGTSTFAFVADNVKRAVHYSVAELIPTIADRAISARLEVPVNTPALLVRHLHVDEKQNRVAVTDALLNDEILRFSVVRTYLDA